MSKARALDLYCGAGGATRGLQRAGFHVTGVDIKSQPRYCGNAFFKADALTFPLDGFDFSLWGGYFAPRATPEAVVQRLAAEIDRIITAPALRTRLEAEGSAVAPQSPERFERFVRDEIAKYTPLVQAAGARLD